MNNKRKNNATFKGLKTFVPITSKNTPSVQSTVLWNLEPIPSERH